MARLLKTPACDSDLYEIWDHIALDSRLAANRMLERLELRLQFLLKHPNTGERQDKFYPGMRSAVEGNYVIFYEPADETMIVHRVIHGARNWEQILAPEQEQ
jgi:toxin ParE1/3/4